jgi:hypothetical protein
MAAGEGGSAAVGPLAGERVPREGERAAVERLRDGALWPVSARRRCRIEWWFGFCPDARIKVTTTTVVSGEVSTLVGPHLSHPFLSHI